RRYEAVNTRFARSVTDKARTAEEGPYGTNRPWRRKTVLFAVAARPSGPPSRTWRSPSCQTVRFVSAIVFGVMASAVVSSVHVAPTFAFEVAVQGTVKVYGVSATVAVSAPVEPFRRSVIRSTTRPWS